MRRLLPLVLLAASAWCLTGAARADTCPPEKFAAAVDASGASLRTYNGEAQPRLRERIKALAVKKGWSGDNQEERAYAYLADGRIAEFDSQSNELLSKIDTLGRPSVPADFECGKLNDLEAANAELLAVMKTKTAYLDEKLDRELGQQAAAAKPAAPAAATAPKAAAAPAAPPKDVTPAQTKPAADTSWNTKTATAPAPRPAPPQIATAPNAGDAYSLPPVTFETSDEGYTIDEIRDATRGFFGTISTSLASVIEHAFSSAGRPTAYILGNEGGGAFLAGLRYGNGTLYLRQGGTRKVYWHGPSLGYDLGAEGGRTLILVYRLQDPDRLYRAYTGVDGSAYLVGGAGMTLLKGGDVIMAPIRSGIGFRLGANVGYLRFTDHPTWNPF